MQAAPYQSSLPMNSPFLFSGKVQFEKTGNPLSDVRIELLGTQPKHTWIGGAQTDRDGQFYIYLPHQTADDIQANQLQALIQISKDETLIYSGNIAEITTPQFISIHTGF